MKKMKKGGKHDGRTVNASGVMSGMGKKSKANMSAKNAKRCEK